MSINKFSTKNFLAANIILILIIFLGIFFRAYRLPSFFALEVDQDLSALVVKDIVANHHLRLVGYETSINGINLGPLYFYLLIPIFLLTKMDPIALEIFSVSVGIITIGSIYYTFKSLFDKKMALFATFLYSVSTPLAFFDRLPLPTQTTILWSVWYLFAIFQIAKGNKRFLFLAFLLIGLIWEVHIALLPLVPLLLLAILISGKKFNLKDFMIPIGITILVSSPFFIFESRHNFQQIHALFASQFDTTGISNNYFSPHRMFLAIDGGRIALGKVFAFGGLNIFITYIATIISICILGKKKILAKKQLILIIAWFLLVLIGQIMSKRTINDFYFDNLFIISILLIALVMKLFLGPGKNNYPLFIFFALFFIYNLSLLINKEPLTNGYVEKKAIVSYIHNDYVKNNYNCAGINYISGPGGDAGFSFLTWYYNLNIIRPSSKIPVYNITVPYMSTNGELKFSGLGLIMPETTNKNITNEICKDPANRLLPHPRFVGLSSIQNWKMVPN